MLTCLRAWRSSPPYQVNSSASPVLNQCLDGACISLSFRSSSFLRFECLVMVCPVSLRASQVIQDYLLAIVDGLCSVCSTNDPLSFPFNAFRFMMQICSFFAQVRLLLGSMLVWCTTLIHCLLGCGSQRTCGALSQNGRIFLRITQWFSSTTDTW